MFENGTGPFTASFFIKWSRILFNQDKFEEAKAVLMKGFEKNAKPTALLEFTLWGLSEHCAVRNNSAGCHFPEQSIATADGFELFDGTFDEALIQLPGASIPKVQIIRLLDPDCVSEDIDESEAEEGNEPLDQVDELAVEGASGSR